MLARGKRVIGSGREYSLPLILHARRLGCSPIRLPLVVAAVKLVARLKLKWKPALGREESICRISASTLLPRRVDVLVFGRARARGDNLNASRLLQGPPSSSSHAADGKNRL